MISILILTASQEAGSGLLTVVSEAGFRPVGPVDGPAAMQAIDTGRPDVVLLDPALMVPAALIPRAVRHGASVVYCSPDESPFEIAAMARAAGVHHFVLASGAAGLREVVAEIMAPVVQLAHAQRRSLLADAAGAIERAQTLTRYSREIVATSRELRVARQVALAACHVNRDVLRETVAQCTRDLRREGVSLEAVRELVHAAVLSTADETSIAAIRDDAALAQEWAAEAYRAA